MESAIPPEIAMSARENHCFWKCPEYPPVTFAQTGETGVCPDSKVYYANGTHTITNNSQQLPGELATNAVGAETFTASIQSASGAALNQLASAEVVVWPVASAALIGIESGQRYFGFPKTNNNIITNAYPTSTTYAQIYKGQESLGTVGIVIPDSTREFDTDTPQNATISSLELESLSEQLPDDGIYTVEVLTVTPFNGGAPERLAHVSFEVHRTITMNAMVATME
jgi:hypothetical protein